MSAIFEDHDASDKHHFYDQLSATAPAESLNLRVLEWRHSDNYDRQHDRTDISITSASSLIARDTELPCPLRIVFAPRDAKISAEHRAVRLLYQHYSVPSSFTLIKTTSPTHAFGHRKGLKDPKNVDVAWTRFLCKDILPLDTQHQEEFHDNFRWIVCDSFLHVRTRNDKDDESKEKKSVTLIFFGAPPKVVQRFERLLASDAWADAVQEPYILLALVYEQLFLLLDKAAWTLAGWFRSKERSALNSVRQDSSSSTRVAEATDFATLHEIAKHSIYMNEAAAAAVLQMETIISHLQECSSTSSSTSLRSATISHLSSLKSSFLSTQLRLSSLSARITNILSLSFNLVTQRDSQILKQDSNAMKAIAVLTLVFLPLTGIASLFSTPFFQVSESHLWVSASIWIFWVITVCLTCSIVATWVWWYRGMKERTGRIVRRKVAEKLG